MSDRPDPLPVDRLALVGLFVTALVVAQLTAAKLLAISIPFALPFAGATLTLPGAALAYALTFFASDCYAELYGRRAAQEMVNVAFLLNFLVLALVWSTIAAPAADPEFASTFATVLGASGNIVAGSLLAYLVSQNWDVVAFHRIREATGGDHLWLRNVGSTATSQFVDTVLFVGVAFYVLPRLGIGTQLGLPLAAAAGPSVAALIVGQYALKLLIAVLDTPFVYAVVGAVRSRDAAARPSVAD
ncbi:queuosine precursor transporter [Halorarum salinum]|uniref:Probable queuosine precursor transporter n=1 Tax=Halorarum salinum TaxID=2743089 RepID=A0A7D5L971_9EURY|nr:queuosine precursor transporter [Halobaculum salinum]QLG60992.1 queuosine precursor transporter [Halobaculum salinum]